jgi:hypothetical protein
MSITLIAILLLALGATSPSHAFDDKDYYVTVGATVLPYAGIRFPSGGQQLRFDDLEGKAAVYNVDGPLKGVEDIFDGTFRVPAGEDGFRGLNFSLESNTNVTLDFELRTADLMGNAWHNQPTLFEIQGSNNESAYAGSNVVLDSVATSLSRSRGLEQFWIDAAIKIESVSGIEPNYYGGSLVITLSQTPK